MNPYTDAPDYAFWSRAIARIPASEVDPVCSPSFQISSDTKVGTAGSCFAQNIAKHLRQLGLEPFITEQPHPELVEVAEQFHYGIYSARYGNLYTARQALQLFQRAFGQFNPAEEPWRSEGGKYIDPFRPLIPEGFATLGEFERDRQQHFAAVRHLFRELDVFVFTLGLTEAWLSRADGAVFPSCPGTAAGVWDSERYIFHNFSVGETTSDLKQLVAAIREINGKAKFLLTVSPVPLVATATGGHVLPSTTYSKAVLRVAAQEVADLKDGVDYFPSYEIITGPHANGSYFAEDRRNVTEEGVAHVMRVFARHYLTDALTAGTIVEPTLASGRTTDQAQAGIDLICDEMYNEQRRSLSARNLEETKNYKPLSPVFERIAPSLTADLTALERGLRILSDCQIINPNGTGFGRGKLQIEIRQPDIGDILLVKESADIFYQAGRLLYRDQPLVLSPIIRSRTTLEFVFETGVYFDSVSALLESIYLCNPAPTSGTRELDVHIEGPDGATASARVVIEVTADRRSGLDDAIAAFKGAFPHCYGAIPYFPEIGRSLLPPNWERPALIVP